MKKRFLALLLTLSLLIGLTACSGNGDNGSSANNSDANANSAAAGDSSENGNDSEDEKVSLTIAVEKHSADMTGGDFTQYKLKLQEIVDELGYDITWLPVTSGDSASEQIAVMLAGDLPDVFWGLLKDSQIIDNSSLFVPLEDKIETMCPNVYAQYEEEVEGWREFITYPDGHIYGLMCNVLFSPNNAQNGTAWINQSWLDQLGMEMPTTMDELKTVLAAFRDNDMDGDGDTTNEIPLDWAQQHYAAKYQEMAHSYGLPIVDGYLFDIVDGKIVSVVDTDQFRNFLEDFHQMSVDGLANMEGPTQTNDQYTSNISSGKVGVFWGWAPYTYITDIDLETQYVPLPPFSAEGSTYRLQPTRNTAKRNGYVITTACENVEAALTLWDRMAVDEETRLSVAFGPEGLTWEFVDGVPTKRSYTADEAIAMGFEDIASNAGSSAFAATIGLPDSGPLMTRARVGAPGSDPREDAIKLYEPYYTEQSIPKGVVPSEIKEEFTFTTDGLIDYINAFACDAILNGVTDESWNSYVSGLPQYGYDYYLEYYQKYPDGDF